MKPKRNWGRVSAFLVLVLMLIALTVFCGLLAHQNMWVLICVYWAVLTLKNIFDALNTR